MLTNNPVASCLGSAMDQQVVTEVFNNYLQAAKILKYKSEWITTINKQLGQLRPGFQLGSDGRILNGIENMRSTNLDIDICRIFMVFTQEIKSVFQKLQSYLMPFRKTLDYRLENGGAGT